LVRGLLLFVGFWCGVAGGVPQEVAEALRGAKQPEVVVDWLAQDRLSGKPRLEKSDVARVLAEVSEEGSGLRKSLDAPELSGRALGELYIRACELRRAKRLAPFRDKLRRVVFTKHYDLGGSHYAYTEGLSDAQAERHFKPGSALCLLQLDGIYATVKPLLEDPRGVIRDPDVSFDATRVLFSWKKSLNQDDYHLYEMDVATGKVRQLTSGLGFADYEGAYLPDGSIVFNSTRCVQTVDCWWTEVSNLYACDPDGGCIRRLTFDQVHTNYPTVTPDGRVIYTRWDYSDRGQVYPQGLFQMYPDGTGQTELYGNNSWFPTSILHARAIPGTGKYVAIFSGHHTRQQGWLGLLDPSKGRQENAGAQLIAPVRPTPAVRIDRYGQSGDLFQYPYPLSEEAFLVAMKPAGARHFALYLVMADGRRELLAWDPKISCNQPVPLAPRPRPHVRPNLVDYTKKTAAVFLQDIYRGPGLAGVARGTVKELRVVALEFRAASIGSNRNSGPAGGALISTPISIQGSWDVKRVLGTARVHDDGSACFLVPARTPIYFQALDSRGFAIQTMRSWLTLQPGEAVSCVGCHENKNSSPPVLPSAGALARGPQRLKPPPWGVRGFSFPKLLQPILDRHCVRCHSQEQAPGATKPRVAFDPKTMRVIVPSDGAVWWYRWKRPEADWFKPDYLEVGWRAGPGGFGRRGTPNAKIGTPWHTPDIWLRRAFTLKARPTSPAFLCHHDEDVEIYLNGVLAARARGYTTDYEVLPIAPEAAHTLKPGKNILAVHCHQTSGGQFIDVAIIETLAAQPTGPAKDHRGEVKLAFSLKGTLRLDPGARRKWSDAYRALANRRYCNWISPQSPPTMLPPYHAGAARSPLIRMLAEGHYGVRLSPDELRTIAAWIDLLVPFAGDYTEAMDERVVPRYLRALEKRRRSEAQEAENIRRLISRRTTRPANH